MSNAPGLRSWQSSIAQDGVAIAAALVLALVLARAPAPAPDDEEYLTAIHASLNAVWIGTTRSLCSRAALIARVVGSGNVSVRSGTLTGSTHSR